MGRYVRLYAAFVRFAIQRSLQFRLDFFFRVGMDVIWNFHYLVFFGVLQLQTPTIGGWNADQVRIFLGSLFVLDGAQMTLFANNHWAFPGLVNKGDLDYHLLRPVSPLFMVSVRDFAVNSFLNFLIAVGILVWAFARYPEPISATSILLYVIGLLFGLVLHHSIHMLSLLPIFWMQGGSGLRDIFFIVDSANGRPVRVFKGWAYRFFTVVLPLGVIVSFPVRLLFEGEKIGIMLHIVAAAAVGFSLMLFTWKRGLCAYGSASS